MDYVILICKWGSFEVFKLDMSPKLSQYFTVNLCESYNMVRKVEISYKSIHRTVFIAAQNHTIIHYRHSKL